uniref:Fibrinogen C-terminal domain-containing protein n=1 Tax=Macrostomum lignano TaxID=282301 RepID=A0A1I8IL27_9PLAT
HEFPTLEVKGDATLASASLSDIPACAVFKAPQSLAPSPHMATVHSTSWDFCTGENLAKTAPHTASRGISWEKCCRTACQLAPLIARRTGAFVDTEIAKLQSFNTILNQIRMGHGTMLLILTVFLLSATGRTSALELKWWSTRESLSDYEAVRSFTVRSRIQCTAAASNSYSAVQLVAFNASSSRCTHYRCRLGLSHCRKCRNVNSGARKVSGNVEMPRLEEQFRRFWHNPVSHLQTASKDCWTTVQHRVSGSVNFYRNWSDYQNEFGEGPDRNYWIGLNALHRRTMEKARKLRILMKAWNNSEAWAEYSSFSVGPGSDNYRLSVTGFSGSAGIGDSLVGKANGSPTSAPGGTPAYKDFADAIGGEYAHGIIWRYYYEYYYSLKEIEMLTGLSKHNANSHSRWQGRRHRYGDQVQCSDNNLLPCVATLMHEDHRVDEPSHSEQAQHLQIYDDFYQFAGNLIRRIAACGGE